MNFISTARNLIPIFHVYLFIFFFASMYNGVENATGITAELHRAKITFYLCVIKVYLSFGAIFFVFVPVFIDPGF